MSADGNQDGRRESSGDLGFPGGAEDPIDCIGEEFEKIRWTVFEKMPAVRVNLQLVWRIEMTQPLRRVERIMLAMNLNDAQTFHSLSQIRKSKGSFAHGLDTH